ncbi:hypothetical protein QF034_000026 [Streptomyces africanus]|uniref:DUF6919 domain-containing protein n=1 Tax=Streptomyces africanus TaxID=231024 RepID=A0ABU0QFS8_9ACTN|nr:hypothetical protein [Streptomyces africanus]
MEVLAAANDGGFLTEGSQPGEVATFHELPWRQRAFVSGFVADPALARALCARAAEAGLVVRGGWRQPRLVRRLLRACF